MTVEELKESLLMTPKNGYTTMTCEQREEMNAYCGVFMPYLRQIYKFVLAKGKITCIIPPALIASCSAGW